MTSHAPVIFDQIPASAPTDAIALDVVFEDVSARRENGIGTVLVEARVRSVARGAYAYASDRVPVQVITICTDPFSNGAEGLIIGRFGWDSEGTWIFTAFQEPFARYLLPAN